MRGRGSYRGRGRDRPQQNLQHSSRGPLMTNHLRDIDIEMEILKRKREMIQQEHELLDREREFSLKRQYIQEPVNSYASYSSNIYRQQGNKRQAVEKSPPRRYDPPPRVDPWQRNSVEPPKTFPKPKNHPNTSKPQPLLSINVDKLYRPQNAKPSNQEVQTNKTKSFPARKDFNPTKVTKAKARTPYLNKPAKEETVTNSAVDFVLRPNVIPSAQVNGRLELALGTILKDVKQMIDSPNDNIMPSASKMIKKIIRDRIRNIMMNKVVKNPSDIVNKYRSKHPLDTDAEMLAVCKQVQAYKLHKLAKSDTDDPIKYFKSNISNLLSTRLDEIFEIVKKIYSKKGSQASEKILDLMDHVPELNEASDAIVVDDQFSEDVAAKSNKTVKAERYSKLMDALLEEKMPTLLQNYKCNIMELIEQHPEYFHTKTKIEDKAMKMACDLVTKKFEDSIHKPDVIIIEDSPAVIDISDEKHGSNDNDAESKSTNSSKAIEVATKVSSTAGKEMSNDSTVTSVKSQTQSSKAHPKTIDFPYFVKLIGRPELPPREAVYDFLKQFKPASIKKHKTVGNLLVLGFNDKEGYNGLLENSGIVISGNTLIIKSNEKVNITSQQGLPQTTEESATASEVVSTEDSNERDRHNVSIGSDLDEQINTLLSTIRNSEEFTAEKEKETPDEHLKNNEEIVNVNIEAKDNLDKEPLESIPKDVESVTVGIIDKENGVTQTENKDSITIDVVKEEVIETHEDSDSTIIPSEKVDSGDNVSENINDKTSEVELASEKLEEKDTIAALKESGRATPTRTSARLAATPSSIKTRRASRLAQNN